jgi:hypothetical protein
VKEEGKEKKIFKVIHPRVELKESPKRENQEDRILKNPYLSSSVIKHDIAPGFMTRKRERIPNKDVITTSKQLNTQKGVENIETKTQITQKEALQDLINKNTNPVNNKYESLQILYMNIQNKWTQNEELLLSKEAKSIDPPDVIILHEVSLKTKALLPEYRTWYHEDGKKKLAILICRDRNPADISITMYKEIPLLKVRKKNVWIVHTLKYLNQHVKLPEYREDDTIIGDFNLPSNLANAKTLLNYKYAAFEAKRDVGIVSDLNFSYEIGNMISDHAYLKVWLNVVKPRPLLIPRKKYVDKVVRRLLLDANRPAMYKTLTNTKRWHRVKLIHKFKRFWQLKEEPIRYINSKFLHFNDLNDKIKKDTLKMYEGNFKKKDQPIYFVKEDRQLLRIMTRLFLSYPIQTHLKSNARDFHGVSYNEIVKVMYERPNTEYWTDRLSHIWSKMKFTVTKMIPLKKRNRVETLDDIRYIGIQDSFMKLFEEMYKPLIFYLQMQIWYVSPMQMGFLPGVDTRTVISMITDKHVLPRQVRGESLIPITELLNK